MSALDRLKLIQSNFKQKWEGISCESCGRPGTSNFVNPKRAVTVIESALQEDERQKTLLKVFNRLFELEEERIGASVGGSTPGSTAGSSRNSLQGASKDAGFYN